MHMRLATRHAAHAAARTHMKHAAPRLQDADDGFWTETEDLAVDLDSTP
ncbi:hypothetical protein ACFRLW_49390 [Streptomyces sp. NPDC056728]